MVFYIYISSTKQPQLSFNKCGENRNHGKFKIYFLMIELQVQILSNTAAKPQKQLHKAHEFCLDYSIVSAKKRGVMPRSKNLQLPDQERSKIISQANQNLYLHLYHTNYQSLLGGGAVKILHLYGAINNNMREYVLFIAMECLLHEYLLNKHPTYSFQPFI